MYEITLIVNGEKVLDKEKTNQLFLTTSGSEEVGGQPKCRTILKSFASPMEVMGLICSAVYTTITDTLLSEMETLLSEYPPAIRDEAKKILVRLFVSGLEQLVDLETPEHKDVTAEILMREGFGMNQKH